MKPHDCEECKSIANELWLEENSGSLRNKIDRGIEKMWKELKKEKGATKKWNITGLAEIVDWFIHLRRRVALIVGQKMVLDFG